MKATPRAYRAIVFDLDGTLIDSAPAMQAIAAAYLGRLGLPPLTLAEARSFIGEGARTFCRRMLAARGVTVDEAALDAHYHDFHALYATAPASDNAFYDGAYDALKAAAARGFRLALCTNKPELPTRKVLDAFGLTPLLHAIVNGDTLPEKKPHPRPLLHAIDAAGARPEETLYVGDSEIDAATAAAAGVSFAFFERGYSRDPASIESVLRFADWSDLRPAFKE